MSESTQPAGGSSLYDRFWREIESLKTPAPKNTANSPPLGSQAPSSPKLGLRKGRPALILFLRHCGCPFAEKSFNTLTGLSTEHKGISFIAVSHSSSEATERWIPQVGGVWNTKVVVDEERDLYAQWGVGLSSTWELASPDVLYSTYRLGKDQGVWNRPTESGSRWQKSAAFAVDGDGIVRWSHVASSANDVPDLIAGLAALGFDPSK